MACTVLRRRRGPVVRAVPAIGAAAGQAIHSRARARAHRSDGPSSPVHLQGEPLGEKGLESPGSFALHGALRSPRLNVEALGVNPLGPPTVWNSRSP